MKAIHYTWLTFLRTSIKFVLFGFQLGVWSYSLAEEEKNNSDKKVKLINGRQFVFSYGTRIDPPFSSANREQEERLKTSNLLSILRTWLLFYI